MLQILIVINVEVLKAGKKHVIYTGSKTFADFINYTYDFNIIEM